MSQSALCLKKRSSPRQRDVAQAQPETLTVFERLVRHLTLAQVNLVPDQDDGHVDAERSDRREPVRRDAVERVGVVDRVCGRVRWSESVTGTVPPQKGSSGNSSGFARSKAHTRGERERPGTRLTDDGDDVGFADLVDEVTLVLESGCRIRSAEYQPDRAQ